MATTQDDTRPDRLPQDAGDQTQQPTRSGGGFFEIRVIGHLDSRWSDWLGSMQVQTLDNGEMVLTGGRPGGPDGRHRQAAPVEPAVSST
jgi:hypothetical protein